MLQEDFHDAGNCKELGDVAVDQYQIEAIVAVACSISLNWRSRLPSIV